MGKLPGWLSENLGGLLEEAWPEVELPGPEEMARQLEQDKLQLQEHVQAWSEEMGPIWNGVILSDLLIALGQPQKAQTLYSPLGTS